MGNAGTEKPLSFHGVVLQNLGKAAAISSTPTKAGKSDSKDNSSFAAWQAERLRIRPEVAGGGRDFVGVPGIHRLPSAWEPLAIAPFTESRIESRGLLRGPFQNESPGRWLAARG